MTLKRVILLTGQTGHWVIPVYRGGVPPPGVGGPPDPPPGGRTPWLWPEAPYRYFARARARGSA